MGLEVSKIRVRCFVKITYDVRTLVVVDRSTHAPPGRTPVVLQTPRMRIAIGAGSVRTQQSAIAMSENTLESVHRDLEALARGDNRARYQFTS